MDLLPNADQAEITSSVDAFLTAEFPRATVRELIASTDPVDRERWKRCAGLGWFGLGLPEEDGGVGYGVTEEALLFREIGRHLTPGPLLATVLGARVAAAAGATRAAAEILDGHSVVGLAEPAGTDGSARVLDGVSADLVLLLGPDGATLTERAGWATLTPVGCVDPASRLAHGRPGAAAVVARVETEKAAAIRERGVVLTAAMLVGLIEATRDMSTRYACQREQFGRPIGTFQAVKHRCADMAVRAEAAYSLTVLAALLVDRGHPDAALHVAAAKALTGVHAVANAADNIQNHGGIGVTAEHDAHLYLKRAHVLATLFGSRPEHLRAVLAAPGAEQVRDS
jgi:alkylation response protein AidB-like acyl-CoA dehydrogenase